MAALHRKPRAALTPRGSTPRESHVWVDPIVKGHVPMARIRDCIARNARGECSRIRREHLVEAVYKTACLHRGFEWWVVRFARQRIVFCGPPELFRPLLGEGA